MSESRVGGGGVGRERLFELVDEEGRTRGSFGMGGIGTVVPCLVLFGADTRPHVSIHGRTVVMRRLPCFEGTAGPPRGSSTGRTETRASGWGGGAGRRAWLLK